MHSSINSHSAIRNPQSRALLYAPQVLRAFGFIEATDSETHDEMIRICEIPAPPFKEQARAAYLRARFEELGLKRVRTDAEGNVIAERPGRAAGPSVMISAHLDTVFPEGTDVRVRRDGVRCYAPGISDNTAGVVSLITLARALDAAQIITIYTIYFDDTVEEEGEDNLSGVRDLFTKGDFRADVGAFVSLDGPGVERITTRALGSRRYRGPIGGPGGHPG